MAPAKTNVHETNAYLRAATQYNLTDHEREAIRQLLIADPMAGSYNHDLKVFVLEWGHKPGLEIMYDFSPALEVMLLSVSQKSDPPDSELLADVIKTTLKASTIVAAKELWDWAKNLL